MKLQQLRFLVAIAEADFNVTAAASRLHTSQPGVSKQIRLLEQELGFELFVRKGRAFTKPTSAGAQVIARAAAIMREIHNIRGLAADVRRDSTGALSIATTHTQARYVLPPVVQRFRQRFPHVHIHLHQGTSEQIAEMMASDRVDFAMATGSEALFPNLVRLPCYSWHRAIVVPRGHPLAKIRPPTLKKLAVHPLISYTFSFSGASSLVDVFARGGFTPEVVLTARDADVIKTYVRLGLGVGIIAPMAVTAAEDPDLVALDASHLFGPHLTWLGFRRGTLLRDFMYSFLEMVAPHLTRTRVVSAERAETAEGVGEVFRNITIPERS